MLKLCLPHGTPPQRARTWGCSLSKHVHGPRAKAYGNSEQGQRRNGLPLKEETILDYKPLFEPKSMAVIGVPR